MKAISWHAELTTYYFFERGEMCLKKIDNCHTQKYNWWITWASQEHPLGAYRIHSIKRPGRLLKFWTLWLGAYWRLGAYLVFTIAHFLDRYLLVISTLICGTASISGETVFNKVPILIKLQQFGNMSHTTTPPGKIPGPPLHALLDSPSSW